MVNKKIEKIDIKEEEIVLNSKNIAIRVLKDLFIALIYIIGIALLLIAGCFAFFAIN